MRFQDLVEYRTSHRGTKHLPSVAQRKQKPHLKKNTPDTEEDEETLAIKYTDAAQSHGYNEGSAFMKEPNTPHFHRYMHPDGQVFSYSHGFRKSYWFICKPDEYVYSGIGYDSAQDAMRKINKTKVS
jgi:hypothetical protein